MLLISSPPLSSLSCSLLVSTGDNSQQKHDRNHSRSLDYRTSPENRGLAYVDNPFQPPNASRREQQQQQQKYTITVRLSYELLRGPCLHPPLRVCILLCCLPWSLVGVLELEEINAGCHRASPYPYRALLCGELAVRRYFSDLGVAVTSVQYTALSSVMMDD